MIEHFITRKPDEEEAKRQLIEYRKQEGKWDNPSLLTDPEIIKLMASYAADQWQEGHEEGWSEGWDAGENDSR